MTYLSVCILPTRQIPIIFLSSMNIVNCEVTVFTTTCLFAYLTTYETAWLKVPFRCPPLIFGLLSFLIDPIPPIQTTEDEYMWSTEFPRFTFSPLPPISAKVSLLIFDMSSLFSVILLGKEISHLVASTAFSQCHIQADLIQSRRNDRKFLRSIFSEAGEFIIAPHAPILRRLPQF